MFEPFLSSSFDCVTDFFDENMVILFRSFSHVPDFVKKTPLLQMNSTYEEIFYYFTFDNLLFKDSPNKYSVINSLLHRANNICSNQEQKKEELTHIEEALTTCKYPSWAIQRVKLKKNIQKQTKEKKTNNSNITNRSSITVPYNQGLSESFKNIGKKYGIQVHFKSGRTIKDELVAPKDKDHITKKSGIIYRFKCDRLECDEEYIGETSRTFGERFKEHLKAPSLIHDHSNTSGHTTILDNFKVVGREEQNLSRLIKESMYIRVNGPSLNKNIGKYHLPHIWDEVLNNSRELKLK